jgi:hypothetical protein
MYVYKSSRARVGDLIIGITGEHIKITKSQAETCGFGGDYIDLIVTLWSNNALYTESKRQVIILFLAIFPWNIFYWSTRQLWMQH